MNWLARARRRATRQYYRAGYALARAVLPTTVSAAPIDPAQLQRIVVLANYQVGDLVVALPAIAYLRDVAPQARLDVVASPRNAPLLDGDPRVDAVIRHDPLRERWLPLARRLRAAHYDLVVDFVLPHHLREGLLTAYVAGRDGARVTSHRPTRYAGLFTHRPRVGGFERRYMAERLLYAVQAATGRRGTRADLARYPVRLTVAPDAAARVAAFLDAHIAGPFVALNAWARTSVRTLGVEQTATIAAAMVAHDAALTVVLTPPPGALLAAEAIATAARARLVAEGDPAAAERVVVFPPAAHIADLVALLARASLVFTPDTANIHLAAGVGRPVVALYTTWATETVAHWRPTGVPFRAVTLDAERPIADLPPAAAIDAFVELWATLRDGTADPASAAVVGADPGPRPAAPAPRETLPR